MTTILFQCAVCTRFLSNDGDEPTCNAFPGGIPEKVWLNRVDHRQPVSGDGGIRFEAVEGFSHPFVEVE